VQFAGRGRRGPEGLRAASDVTARDVPREGRPGDRREPRCVRASVILTRGRLLTATGSRAWRAPRAFDTPTARFGSAGAFASSSVLTELLLAK